ncbi:hypothetical protein BVK86_20785 [Pseudomonas reinekei]|uniref:Uncharacterized protein n=1 Tax=Pseudomonas reinekei TaxID=395598 RepID=A0A1Q9WPD4_PSERE|nr:hypothetical protein BVK86_20785 [Pseudomonas reinekei]
MSSERPPSPASRLLQGECVRAGDQAGGPTEQDRSEGMPSLGEAPNERGKSPLVTLGLFQSDPL